MAFDPALPQTNSPVSSAEMRDQLTGLADLINQCAGLPDKLAPLQVTISNPPTQAQVQAIVDQFNDLLDALKRV